jgi:hypothetical protein
MIASYLPQPTEEHERACHALARLPVALSHHLLILHGLHGGWTGSNSKDTQVQTVPFLRWKGAETPTFTPLYQPCLVTCIYHLAICDPRHLSDQIGDTVTLSASFLDYKGVLGTIHLPVLTEEAVALPLAWTPRVPTLLFPVSEHAMKTWRSKVAVDSSAVIALLSAMARSLLDCLL